VDEDIIASLFFGREGNRIQYSTLFELVKAIPGDTVKYLRCSARP
jgi:hypothetical protein